METKDYEPLGEYVLVEIAEKQTQTAGGIHLPESVQTGSIRVVACGPGRVLDSGAFVEPRVKPGDVVFARKGTMFHYPNGERKEVALVLERDIMARKAVS